MDTKAESATRGVRRLDVAVMALGHQKDTKKADFIGIHLTGEVPAHLDLGPYVRGEQPWEDCPVVEAALQNIRRRIKCFDDQCTLPALAKTLEMERHEVIAYHVILSQPYYQAEILYDARPVRASKYPNINWRKQMHTTDIGDWEKYRESILSAPMQ